MPQASDAVIINKQLAWAMLVAILCASFWFGQTLSGITAKIDALEDARLAAALDYERASADVARDFADHEARLRPLEVSAPAIAQALADIKAAQREQGATLHSLYRALNGPDETPASPRPQGRTP